MKASQAVWRNGQILPMEPVDWPEGTELAVGPAEVLEQPAAANDLLGNEPASIDAWVAWFDALEPFDLAPEEEMEWSAARREQRDWEKARFEERRLSACIVVSDASDLLAVR